MQPPPKGRASWLQGLLWAAKLLFAAGAVYLVLRLVADVRWLEIVSLLGQAHWGWLAAGVGCLLARYVVWAQRWQLAIERVEGPSPSRFPLLAITASAAINLMTPTAKVLGVFARARYMSRVSGGPLGRSFGAVLHDQIHHQAVTAGLTLVVLVLFAALLGRYALAATVAIVVIGGLVILIAWSRRRGPSGLDALARLFAARAARKAGTMGRLALHGREAVRVARELLRDPVLRRRSLALSFAFFLLNVVGQWAVFKSLGSSPGWGTVLAGVALGTTAGFLLGTPGGIGVTEGAMIACYVALGVGRVEATAATFLFRTLHYTAVAGFGLPALLFLELTLPKSNRDAETSSTWPPDSSKAVNK